MARRVKEGRKHGPKCPGCKRRRELLMRPDGQCCQDCAYKRDRKAAS